MLAMLAHDYQRKEATELREIYRHINDAKHVVVEHLRLETHLKSKTRFEFLGNTCILVNRFHISMSFRFA